MSTNELLQDALRYRGRAEEVETIADAQRDTSCRAALYACARIWHQMAENAETNALTLQQVSLLTGVFPYKDVGK